MSFQTMTGDQGSAIDLDMGPAIDPAASRNYKNIKEVGLVYTDTYG